MNSGDLPWGAGESGSPAHEHAKHASYVFLIDDTGAVHPVPHGLYVALARDGAGSAAFAGTRLRLADWYVRLSDGSPARVVNEWYGWVSFDERGRFDPSPDLPQRPVRPPGAQTMDTSALPTAEERKTMEAVLFGGEWPPHEDMFDPGSGAQG
ncbi:hypothetical protein [Azohydromonas lata]|uniref:hypothetical protein n=1 Tax=Azohydromonas lata TaxID=45677 RepID=UPI0008322154|nr:hypothetical protein [Azohydromonas lata]